VVNSQMVAKEIQENFGTPPERLHLVYNGYDLPEHESSEEPGHGRLAIRQRLGVPADANLALFTGSGWQRKGLIHAVEAMRELDRKDLHLVVAGSGKMSPAFRHPRVHFPGPVLDIAPLYAAADFYDPFSNACLEAARHGLPVVTTTANGFAEWIAGEVNGLVVPPGNTLQLAKALDYWAAGFRAREARATCASRVAHLTVAANTEATLKVVLN
jgi:UDP-glucose:(heptosyl)LPS alpha-1,3-glucosyltransferase